ncbi:hypothetical protein P0W64_04080 [Tsukamurella sp. 8F]|uniref:hypothetical protein n=1 Tax=unclassified Tsukamurella TaxID=2633480 RepID=UPI0023B9DDF9|nr:MULTISPECIES: hypothetical protein [unclassified Tsukamurella]MDF0529665.1 hypothetical protein [Tsukamurella sp. 8J]MDF0585950.1 hypothetical protein [Tsukamurella sp. 8F]
MSERFLRVPDAARADLVAFVSRLLRTDESAVLRVRRRDPVATPESPGQPVIEVWGATGFGILAVRVIPGAVSPDSMVASAALVRDSLQSGDVDVDTGYSMDSAWRGALPPPDGFDLLDSVPAKVLHELAEHGAEVGRETGGPAGPPPSLLDSHVLEVEGAGRTVGIALRTTFALRAMGFAGDGPDEPVRVRASATWVRLDARYGSLYQRAEAGPRLLV